MIGIKLVTGRVGVPTKRKKNEGSTPPQKSGRARKGPLAKKIGETPSGFGKKKMGTPNV